MAPQVNLTRTYRKEADGRVVTVGDAIVEYLAGGNYLETAAAAVGIGRSTLFRYLFRGGTALRLSAATGKAVPKADKVYADFAARVEAAQAQAEATMLEVLTLAATGGLRVTETQIEFNVDGEGTRTEVKRTEVTRNLAPNVRAIMWRLERRNPKRWGRPGSLAPTNEDGSPVLTKDERIDSIENMLTDWQVGFDDGLAVAEERAQGAT